jgi:hypothetical protein
MGAPHPNLREGMDGGARGRYHQRVMLTPAQLDAIIAAIKRREVPPELQDFVHELVRQRLAPRSWLGQLMFGGRERHVHCEEVVERTGLEGLVRALIFDAGVDVPGLLEWGAFPGVSSHGTFAVSPSGFRYLNRRPAEVEALFREEPAALWQTTPANLAAFLVEVLERRLNASHEVLFSVEHLEHYQRRGIEYPLDPREWARVRPLFISPTRHEQTWGFRLEFCTVHGWLHAKRQLTRQIYDVTLNNPELEVRSYRDLPRSFQYVGIRHSEQILSPGIFAARPAVRP